MADGKLYIIVTDQLPGGQGPITPDKPKKEKKEKDDLLSDYAQHQFFNLITNQAKTAVQYTIGNIGNFTGSYVTQEHINNAISAIGFLERVGMAALAGSKYGGWGAAIGAAVAIVGEGVSQGLNIFSNILQMRRQNEAVAQLKDRAGLNAINNGSRGTEY